ncbi:hypothetical protein GCK72_011265 [Caenorhabditis remanei]|uniref:Uncharacterized protein n=1 Tax=Caenorhabditis remanei TaxID=31234 RepID=A0A6A5H595_CAERE|nr:hypothetical protein GCK72_011265 [Caenorhabditis remanei]KAF1763000.1 hypothetical protein GCK72_011265 [Caenorhabditis remanei]
MYLKSGRTPIHKLDASLRLDRRNSSIHIFRHNVSTEQKTNGHILSMSWITLDHLIMRFEAHIGDFSDGKLFVIRLLGRNDRRECGQREMDSGVRYQICLEFCQVDVECSVETKRRGDRGDDLTDETVQVGVGGTFDVKVATTDVVNCL